jgi:regulation of enolase protein 1 (concanavalin A-like superfamily)
MMLLFVFLVNGQVFGQGSAPKSDDFNNFRLNEDIWTFTNPEGSAAMRVVGTNSPDAWLQLSVPKGNPQDVWFTGIRAPRVMQAVRNVDFEVEVKFESGVRSGQSQGILVEQDTGNWVQIYFTTDNQMTQLVAASATNFNLNLSEPNLRIEIANPDTSPLWMRVNRVVNDWTVSYSLDGSEWVATPTFTQRVATAQIGLYAGVNSFFGDAPEFTMLVDYFSVTSAPVTEEDATIIDDTFPPLIVASDPLSYDDRIIMNWSTDEQATTMIDYGLTDSFELGTIESTNFVVNHSVELPGLEPGLTYNVRLTSQDGMGNISPPEVFTITTLGAAPTMPVITLWYGENQTFGNIGVASNWVNIVGRAEDADPGDRIRISYSVNEGEYVPVNVGPDRRRLSGNGDFNIEIVLETLREGENEIIIRAEDRYENRTNVAVYVNFSARNVWNIPWSAEWAEGVTAQQNVQVVDGHWTVNADGVRIVEPGYRRMIAIGDISWTDYEVLLSLTVHELVPGDINNPLTVDAEPFLGLIPRWVGYYDWDDSQPAVGPLPVGAFARYVWRSAVRQNDSDGLELLDGNLGFVVEDPSQISFAVGDPYLVRLRAITSVDGSAFYSLRLWRAEDSEPTWWNVATVVPAGGRTNGALALVANRVDVTFNAIDVIPLTPEAYVLQTYANTPPECAVLVLGSGANLRTGAGPNFSVARSVAGGEQIAINGQVTGADGFVWYRTVEDSAWVRADLVQLDTECEALVQLD